MKAKMKAKEPLEFEFEMTGKDTDAEEWLNKAIKFLSVMKSNRVSLKIELKEIIVPETTEA